MIDVEGELQKLGYKGKDKVTGMQGVITSISFDLYGCNQVLLNPGLDKDGKPRDAGWYDSNRIEVISKDPIMNQPDFANQKGPEIKPIS
ncbi:MAG: hypothetical protein SVK08_00690 [Halobacteriota archaeon]|nr:hypothetical protein [Halobacteriota archaeon]